MNVILTAIHPYSSPQAIPLANGYLKASLAAAHRLDTSLRGVTNLPGGYGEQLAGLIGYLEGELEKVVTPPES